MCGIVGEVGSDQTVNLLLHGLKKLEYRGYDSAGIYVNDDDDHDYLIKVKGRISELESKIGPEVHGKIGIAHTRWATHGAPSVANAHPFVSSDGRYLMVHNGVITNFKQLKEEYLKCVHFESETDSEVIVQLIAHFAAQGMTMLETLKKTLSVLNEGSTYAILLIDRENPETLYAAKKKSPLLIGIGKGFNVICSDAMAMLNVTHAFIELHDGDIAELTDDDVKIQDKDGNQVLRKPFHVNEDASASEKGSYAHFMLKEINEQPTVMRRLIQEYTNEDGTSKIEKELIKALENADRLYIIGAGTSYHAGLIGHELFEKYIKTPTEVHVASEFAYNRPLLSKKPFFIFLSQSGETADSHQVLGQVNEMHYPSLTITNVAKSTLSREATYTLLLHAGPEIAVASTKAYTAQISVEALLAKAVGDDLKDLDAKNFDVRQELSTVANGMQEMLDNEHHIEKLSQDYLAKAHNAFYLGRAIDYDTAIEAALKLKEVSYIQTEGFAAGELKHGTIALIEKGTPVIAIITAKKIAAHTRSNAEEVVARGAHLMTMVSRDLANANDQIILPDVHPLLTPLVAIIPAQLLAYYASEQRGYDVDKPRNLAKSVTVE